MNNKFFRKLTKAETGCHFDRIDSYAEEIKRMEAQINISKAKLDEEAHIKSGLEVIISLRF